MIIKKVVTVITLSIFLLLSVAPSVYSHAGTHSLNANTNVSTSGGVSCIGYQES